MRAVEHLLDAANAEDCERLAPKSPRDRCIDDTIAETMRLKRETKAKWGEVARLNRQTVWLSNIAIGVSLFTLVLVIARLFI